jgi:hypothetical protein
MRRRRRSRPSKSSGAARALALFAILCGAIAFAASFGHGGEASAEHEQTGPDPAAISRALDHLESASHALDATDYGRTRFHLHESRRTLTNALK